MKTGQSKVYLRNTNNISVGVGLITVCMCRSIEHHDGFRLISSQTECSLHRSFFSPCFILFVCNHQWSLVDDLNVIVRLQMSAFQ